MYLRRRKWLGLVPSLTLHVQVWFDAYCKKDYCVRKEECDLYPGTPPPLVARALSSQQADNAGGLMSQSYTRVNLIDRRRLTVETSHALCSHQIYVSMAANHTQDVKSSATQCRLSPFNTRLAWSTEIKWSHSAVPTRVTWPFQAQCVFWQALARSKLNFAFPEFPVWW